VNDVRIWYKKFGLVLDVGLVVVICCLSACAAGPLTPDTTALVTPGVTIDEVALQTMPSTLAPGNQDSLGLVYIPDMSSLDGSQPLALQTKASPIPIPSVTPTSQSPEICSPLGSVDLIELAGVVSGVYAPPPPGKDDRHQGVDFSYWRRGERTSILGDGVQSVLAGTIAGIVIDRYPYGNAILVESRPEQLPEDLRGSIGFQLDESLYLLYAHMETPPSFQLGEQVVSCQLLGTVGKSGNAGVAHLHLETRLGPAGSRFGSMAYYIEATSTDERQTYVLWRTSGVYRHLDPMILFVR
jgi:murein DD-endopeptidase MepM/ murein hydrolase activator NlpD